MPPHFFLEYYDPPPGLERHVLALFHFIWDEPVIRDRHPGALPQLVLIPHGRGSAEFAGGQDQVPGEALMLGGFSTSVPFRIEGPWHAVGASLSPLGWAALTGQPASRFRDRFIPAGELLGAEVDNFAEQANGAYRRGEVSGKQLCDMLAEWIAERLQPVPPAHERVIGQTIAWLGSSLNPDVEQLFGEVGYSRRQAERLVERYFGFTPAALARKFRAVRAASLLADENLSDEAQAEIAEAFHDQPHMIREIRRFCGYTPSRLGGSEEPLFQTMLRLKNLDRLERFRKIR